MRVLVLIFFTVILSGCASGNSLRNAYRPVPLNGQTVQVIETDNAECRTIGYRAGQGLDALTRSNDLGLVLVGGGAGRLAGGSTGGAVGTGAGLAISGFSELVQRGQLMHAAYRACMRGRGYVGEQEMPASE